MNTSKQVNVMIGLLIVGALATLLYYLWDGERQSAATERQLTENAERGGALFSLNCRACHGLTGLGSLETAALPGAALNTDANREADQARQTYLRDTIRCGRVGTLMPAWSTEQGGSLNFFQIDQLVALLTGVMPDFDQDASVVDAGWEHALEEANHADEFDPLKHLEEDINAGADTLVLDNPRGLNIGQTLRLDDEPEDEIYEIVEVLDTPAGSQLEDDVGREGTTLVLQEASLFEPGDVIIIDDELMEVTEAPARAALASDAAADATSLEVDDAAGFAREEVIEVGVERMRVESVSGNTLEVERGVDDTEAVDQVAETPVVEDGTEIEVERAVQGSTAREHRIKAEVFEIGNEIIVERGAFQTTATEHAAGTEVFNGPIPPPDTVTGSGEGFPPCGQSAPVVTGGEEVEVTGTLDMDMGDNFFDAGGTQNPTLAVPANTAVTVNLTSVGENIHNMVVAGLDNEFGTDDDFRSDPDVVQGGGTATLQFTLTEAGTYDYRCDFHPAQMVGEVVVQ